MNMDSALDLVCDWAIRPPIYPPIRRPRPRRIRDDLWGLKRESDAAIADFQSRVVESYDYDLRHFLVFRHIQRVERTRARLRALVMRRPEALAPNRGGEGWR
jgi:hypothetical protein